MDKATSLCLTVSASAGVTTGNDAASLTLLSTASCDPQDPKQAWQLCKSPSVCANPQAVMARERQRIMSLLSSNKDSTTGTPAACAELFSEVSVASAADAARVLGNSDDVAAATASLGDNVSSECLCHLGTPWLHAQSKAGTNHGCNSLCCSCTSSVLVEPAAAIRHCMGRSHGMAGRVRYPFSPPSTYCIIMACSIKAIHSAQHPDTDLKSCL